MARAYVRNHRVYWDHNPAIPFLASPNQSEGLEPRYLIVHYTATRTLSKCVKWFLSPKAKASAHLIVDRDGVTVQMVPLDQRAWHAGQSRWGVLENLNAHSIGIELVNAGALEKSDERAWVDWTGRAVPDNEVLVARHKHESAMRGWQTYTDIQIERALQIAAALCEAYQLRDVLGHDDVAPDRKIDPGPAFPMERFASAALGRNAEIADRSSRRQP